MSGRREEILDAALAIADERGLEAVSMRALADRVGVTPMALYRHVKDKAALLDGMVGRLLSALLPSDPSQERTWDEQLSTLAHACRQVAQRHPWAAHLLFSRPAVTPDAVRAVDIIYLALIEAGVPEPEVPRLERLISTFVIGFAASEASGRFTPAPSIRATAAVSLRTANYPATAGSGRIWIFPSTSPPSSRPTWPTSCDWWWERRGGRSSRGRGEVAAVPRVGPLGLMRPSGCGRACGGPIPSDPMPLWPGGPPGPRWPG